MKWDYRKIYAGGSQANLLYGDKAAVKRKPGRPKGQPGFGGRPSNESKGLKSQAKRRFVFYLTIEDAEALRAEATQSGESVHALGVRKLTQRAGNNP